ncbi:MAG: YbaK/EbsC family protein [Lysobacterales bacterium]|jgi:Ala-tRNA(Pro) deacylase
MAIAMTLKSYLENHHIEFDSVEHSHTETTVDAARSAHVPPHLVAKAVVLKDNAGFLVAVLPSNNRLNIAWVNEELERNLELATEDELAALFKDCETGAVPALSNAYGLKVIWDDQLKHASDIYIEAGDHEHLIHLPGDDFRKLMAKLPHSVISAGKEYSRWVYE